MKSLLFILFLLLFSLKVIPQGNYHTTSKSAAKNFEKALKCFDNREDEKALKYLKKAVKSDAEFIEAYMMMSQIYKDRNEFTEAISSYEKALKINPKFNPPGYLVLADVEMSQGLYSDALTHAERFLELGDFKKVSRSDAERFTENCRFALDKFNHPVPFVPVNLGDSVNSDKNEYWPSLSLDESKLIITVLDPADPSQTAQKTSVQEDFYESFRKPDGTWAKRKNVGPPLNTNDNEGAQTISADGRFLFFTGCNRPDGQGKCDIYFSENINGTWSVPVNIGYPVNTAYSEKHPSISADGRRLFFASDRPGGLGGLDIWVSQKQSNGFWSLPVNLGENINTPGNEQSPFIHPDNQSLYFSSEGHLNMGKGDIFISRLDSNNSWLPAVNLGYPINTWNNEVGLIVNAAGDKAYYASDRQKDRGLDIYEFPLYPEARPIPVSYMKGRVYDALTWKGIEATFQLFDLQSGELVMESSSAPEEGDFLVSLPAGRNYALNVSKPGYLFYSDHFSMAGIHKLTDPLLKDVPLSPIRQGETVVLKNVFFAFDSFEVQPESQAELNKIIDFLNVNPSVQIEISGHTDNIGNIQYNQALSEKRARAVVDYLSGKGIQINRLSYKGYGSSVPKTENDTEEGRSINRRTELRIVN
jgi:outer membrane protein OmpA-like peptidoglycan-associated protein/Tol biopolymer transport system component